MIFRRMISFYGWKYNFCPSIPSIKLSVQWECCIWHNGAWFNTKHGHCRYTKRHYAKWSSTIFFYRFVLSFSVYFRFITVSSFSSLYQICAQVYLHYIHKSLSCKAVLLRAILKWNLNARGRWMKPSSDPSRCSIANMVS